MSAPFELDAASLLVWADGAASLHDLEAFLEARGLSLGFAIDAELGETPIATWLAEGAKGAPEPTLDPSDHLVAGIAFTLPSGATVDVAPSPRRATGPDLISLALGTGALVRVERAWLRVHRRDVRPRTFSAPAIDLDPPLSDGEARLFGAFERALREGDHDS